MASNSESISSIEARPATVDRWAILLSVLCMVHCLATPFILALFPFIYPSHDELFFHGAMMLPLAGFAFWAFWRGYKLHKRLLSIGLGLAGFTLLAFGLASADHFIFIQEAANHAHSHSHAGHAHTAIDFALPVQFQFTWGAALTILGSILLIVAHVYNMRFCNCACHDHK